MQRRLEQFFAGKCDEGHIAASTNAIASARDDDARIMIAAAVSFPAAWCIKGPYRPALAPLVGGRNP